MLNRLFWVAFLVQPLTASANTPHFFSGMITASPGKPVPGIISKFYGNVEHGAATICWKLYEEGSKSLFFIERSENGKDFEELDMVSSADGINFQYKDSAPLATGFYRIKAIGADTIYSSVMRLSTLSGLPQIKIWPAVFDVIINVEVSSKIKEDFSVVLTNSKGEILISKEITVENGSHKITLDDTVSFLYADEYSITVTGLQYAFSQKLYKK